MHISWHTITIIPILNSSQRYLKILCKLPLIKLCKFS